MLATAYGVLNKLNKKQRNVIQFGIGSLPYSTDPLEYDSFTHHITLRSIFSSLVSAYKAGEIHGDIADSWSQEDNFKTWKFKISKSRSFENGDKISPEIIVNSLKRAFYVMKKKGSLSGVAENVLGIDSFNSISGKISGLQFDSNTVVFQLKESDPNFLNKISFGLYGIVHPNDYDSKSGDWKNSKSIISSGFYKISGWTKDEFLISLRSDINKNDLLDRPIENIRFFVPANIADFNTTDMAHGSSETMLFEEGYSYVGPVNQTIRYVLCGGWRDPKSICYDVNNRRLLRSIFYEQNRKNNLKIVRSFFPLSIPNTVENVDPKILSNKLKLDNLRKNIFVTPTRIPLKSKSKITESTYIEAFQKFVDDVSKSNNLEVVKSSWDSPNTVSSANSYDIGIYFTGILVESPMDDIRFMFQSKHGIQLPDASGEIADELKEKKLNIQKISKIMWDQAIVWPVNHLSLGIWLKGSSGVSAKQLNTTLPPIDFRWIEWVD